MKHILLFFGIIFSAAMLNAQSSTSLTPQQEDAHAKALRMQKVFNLTDDQVVQMEQVWLEFIQNTARIRGDVSLSPDAAQRMIEQETAERNRKFSQIFTPMQYKQFQQLNNETQQIQQQNR